MVSALKPEPLYPPPEARSPRGSPLSTRKIAESHPARRTVLAAGAAWSAATIVAASPAPAFAASSTPRPGDYMALIDTQAVDTNQKDTNATTWPHGLISDDGDDRVKFQLGMQMMLYDESLYNTVQFDTYKNWTSGPITVQLTFDNTVYELLADQATWLDEADNGGAAWEWTATTTQGAWTTLTFTHDSIAYNGNTLGMPTQTGGFVIPFTLLKNPGAQTPPSNQPAGGRTVTDSMRISVNSDLQRAETLYVQEDSTQIS